MSRHIGAAAHHRHPCSAEQVDSNVVPFANCIHFASVGDPIILLDHDYVVETRSRILVVTSLSLDQHDQDRRGYRPSV